METRLRIKGMTCAGCAVRVQQALAAVPGVDRVVVELGEKEARIAWKAETDAPKSLDALLHAVHRAGYGAAPLDDHGKKKNAWSLALTLGLPVTALLMIAEWVFHFDHRSWYSPFAFWITLPVLVAVGGQFYVAAFRQLRRGRVTMDTLVTVGSLAAWGLSLYGWLRPGWIYHPYFMEAAAIVSLIGVGHWLEGRISRRANTTLRQLLTVAPAWARRLLPSGEEEKVALSDLAIGDTLLIKPGDHIPIDGRVFENHGAVDESLLTGESQPVEKAPGSPVYAGTLNVSHRLMIHVTGLGAETALARVIAAVERAQGSRAAIESLVDRVSRVFVLVVLVLAAATFALWLHAGAERALVTAVSVLIVACPCALGLATPAALLAATNAAARRGVLFRDAAALEKCGRITTVLFDKTGTLTESVAAVEKVHILTHRLGPDEFAALARALASSSTHPVSRSVAAHFSYGAQIKLEAWREEAGLGITALYQGETARLGAPAWVREQGVAFLSTTSTTGGDLAISLGQELIGLIRFNPHRPRPEAARVLRALRDAGLEIAMVSGDTKRSAQELAERIGISEERVFAPVLPGGKADLIAQLQREGRSVAFVGDGMNDGPALAQADLGIAVMEASDLAREAADVVLLHRENDLEALPEIVGLAAATRRVIIQNLAWALIYNVALIPLAMAGKVPPIAAAAAMGLSDLCVMGNAWRLSRWK